MIYSTKLSIAVIAGRSAWNSFHKGGNYKVQTDEITKTDFEFLKRLKKFKHFSVFEHINLIFKNVKTDINSKFFYIKNNHLITNLRFILENEDELKGYYNDKELKKLKKLKNELKERIFSKNKILKKFILDEEYEGNEAYISKEKINYTRKILHDKIFNKKNELIEEFYSFQIFDISRALLQELVRHKAFSAFTVKSTRYTLKELKNEKSFFENISIQDLMKFDKNEFYEKFDIKRAEKYLIFTKDYEIDITSIIELELLRKLLLSGKKNDYAKFCLPESYKTSLVFTINGFGFDKLIKLRESKDALWEFQNLAKKLKSL